VRAFCLCRLQIGFQGSFWGLCLCPAKSRFPTAQAVLDMLDLAIHIVDTKRGKFEPEKFEDYYENAHRDAHRSSRSCDLALRGRDDIL
jgi:hypothetical protein